MKLILEILNEEIKSTRSTLHIGYNTNNSWLTAKTNSLHSSTNIQPSKSKHSTHGIQAAYQYAVPVANRYTVLSSYQELQESNDVIPPSNTKHLSTFKTGNNCNHIKGLHRKKNTAMYQPRLLVTYLPNKHNLQKPRKTENEDETSYIPTIVNGVINVISTSKTEL